MKKTLLSAICTLGLILCVSTSQAQNDTQPFQEMERMMQEFERMMGNFGMEMDSSFIQMDTFFMHGFGSDMQKDMKELFKDQDKVFEDMQAFLQRQMNRMGLQEMPPFEQLEKSIPAPEDLKEKAEKGPKKQSAPKRKSYKI